MAVRRKAAVTTQWDLYRSRLGVWESEGGRVDADPLTDPIETTQPAG